MGILVIIGMAGMALLIDCLSAAAAIASHNAQERLVGSGRVGVCRTARCRDQVQQSQ